MSLRSFGLTSAFSISLVFMTSVLFSPSGAFADTDERGVSFFTLRDRGDGDDPSDYFGEGRGSLTAGWCGVDQTELKFLAPAAEIAPFRIPEEILDVDRVEELPVDTVLESVSNGPDGEMLMYIHGYYIDFEKGCRRATIFKENVGLDDNFLWFSWPSAGSFVNYPRDEVNLFWSVPDMARAISDLHARFGDGNVNLAGHSLGGRGLALALYEVANANPEAKFGEVVFLAPDIDSDVFRKLLPRIRPIAQSITLYTSSLDAALVASEQLHGYPRLGQSGNDVALLDGVEVVDVSDLPFTSANGHLYHIYNSEVGSDLNQLVTQGTLADQRRNLDKTGSNLWRLLPDK